MRNIQGLAILLITQGSLLVSAGFTAQYSTLNLANSKPVNTQGPPSEARNLLNAPLPAASHVNVQFAPQPQPPRQYPGDDDFQFQQPQSAPSFVNNQYIQAPCQPITEPNGDIKFQCRANPADLTWSVRHVLWITPETQKPQNYNIEVDNYKLKELIQAGFKPGQTQSQFNILVKRPEHDYEAQVEKFKTTFSPKVNLQYQPVRDLLVHYPTDKNYSPLRAPIELPGGGGQQQINPRFSRNPAPERPWNHFQQNGQQFRPSGFQHQQPNRQF